MLVLAPRTSGFQDLGALIARQPAVTARWHNYIFASPFGTIHAAAFSLPRPVGTAMPPPPTFALASHDPRAITGSISAAPLGDPPPLEFPIVNRATKGDALVARPRPPQSARLAPLPTAIKMQALLPQAGAEVVVAPPAAAEAALPRSTVEEQTATRVAESEPVAQASEPVSPPQVAELDPAPQISAPAAEVSKVEPVAQDSESEPAPQTEVARSAPQPDDSGLLPQTAEAEPARPMAKAEPPQPSAGVGAPTLDLDGAVAEDKRALNAPATPIETSPDIDVGYTDLPPADLAAADSADQGAMRLYFGIDPIGALQGAIAPWASGAAPVVMAPPASDPDLKQSALGMPAIDADTPGEMVASKGEVTGADQRPKSPAERLALAGPARAKAEKCLANAIYFEARAETVRGQIAVAQVVINRVFSPFYPKDVCGVVYQNAERRYGCQFTFACDGIPDVVTEPDAYVIARHIAREVLDGKLWVTDVGKSTHYHANWVRPSWVGEMHKLLRLGVHTFYRPRAWGSGADEPNWGNAKATIVEAEKLGAKVASAPDQ